MAKTRVCGLSVGNIASFKQFLLGGTADRGQKGRSSRPEAEWGSWEGGQLRGLGSAINSPSGVWGGASETFDLYVFLDLRKCRK